MKCRGSDGSIQSCRWPQLVSQIGPLMAVLVAAWTWIGTASPVSAAGWPEAAARIEQRAAHIRRQARQVNEAVDRLQQQWRAELPRLQARVQRQEAVLEARKATFSRLSKREAALRRELQGQQHDARMIKQVVHSNLEEMARTIRKDPFLAEEPSKLQVFSRFSDPDTFPRVEDLNALVDLLFWDMARSGEIVMTRLDLINPAGKEISGDVLRVGTFTAYYRANGTVGFLCYQPETVKYLIPPGKPSWTQSRAIRRAFAKTGDTLPLDLSGGLLLRRFNNPTSILSWLRSGGFLVWPILLIGLIASLLIMERIIFFVRLRFNVDGIVEQICTAVRNGQWDECRTACWSLPRCPTGRILRAGLENLGKKREAFENALQEAMLKELPCLERFLSTLSVLAAIAPLLGLLGTVSGMITTFQAITLYGAGDPTTLSGGISEALITTQLGLSVAIPILIAHHFLERRMDRILGDMEEKAATLTAIFYVNGGTHSGVDNCAV